jgi:hypothetical protein
MKLPTLEKAEAQMKMNEFYCAITEKFLKVAEEKDRSLKPWDDHDYWFLIKRLQEEYDEFGSISLFDDDYQRVHHSVNLDEQQDELIDIAALCAFIYHKLEKEKLNSGD